MSGETILIEQLRAEVDRLELDLAAVAMCDSSDCGLCVSCLVKRAEKAERERDVLRHHYEEAIPEHNLFALLDMYDGRRAAAERERDEARAERDARPDISAEDALLMEDARATLELPAYEHGPEHQDAAMRIARAIRAHAAKSVKP